MQLANMQSIHLACALYEQSLPTQVTVPANPRCTPGSLVLVQGMLCCTSAPSVTSQGLWGTPFGPHVASLWIPASAPSQEASRVAFAPGNLSVRHQLIGLLVQLAITPDFRNVCTFSLWDVLACLVLLPCAIDWEDQSLLFFLINNVNRLVLHPWNWRLREGCLFSWLKVNAVEDLCRFVNSQPGAVAILPALN